MTPEPEYDDRIAAVLDHLRATPSPPPSIQDLTNIAHPSQSRLQHLFRNQVGVPIRRYLLWHRYLTALSLLADGASVTRAAHAAGFADSAHLTRTAVRMNGFTPTKMPFGMLADELPLTMAPPREALRPGSCRAAAGGVGWRADRESGTARNRADET